MQALAGDHPRQAEGGPSTRPSGETLATGDWLEAWRTQAGEGDPSSQYGRASRQVTEPSPGAARLVIGTSHTLQGPVVLHQVPATARAVPARSAAWQAQGIRCASLPALSARRTLVEEVPHDLRTCTGHPVRAYTASPARISS